MTQRLVEEIKPASPCSEKREIINPTVFFCGVRKMQQMSKMGRCCGECEPRIEIWVASLGTNIFRWSTEISGKIHLIKLGTKSSEKWL